jgi:hypothetical protein
MEINYPGIFLVMLLGACVGLTFDASLKAAAIGALVAFAIQVILFGWEEIRGS